MSKCIECGRELLPVEIGLTKKLINRGSTEFLCKTCLAKKFKTTEKRLDEMVQAFIEQGCSLFTRIDK